MMVASEDYASLTIMLGGLLNLPAQSSTGVKEKREPTLHTLGDNEFNHYF
jgi:hypothetical protein